MKKKSKKRFKLKHLGTGLLVGLAMSIIVPLIMIAVVGSAVLIIGGMANLFPERLFPLALLIGTGIWAGLMSAIMAAKEDYEGNL